MSQSVKDALADAETLRLALNPASPRHSVLLTRNPATWIYKAQHYFMGAHQLELLARSMASAAFRLVPGLREGR